MGTAINSLKSLHYLLRPSRITSSSGGGFGFFVIIGNMIAHVVLSFLSAIVMLWIRLLSHLVWHDMQKAEYLADRLGANASGTTAALSLLEKLHLGSTYWLAVQHAYLGYKKQNLFDAVKLQIAAVPQHELERIRRAELMEDFSP